MQDKIFDPKKLNKLNNLSRLIHLPPELIIEKADIKNPNIIIDIGAGTGFYSIPFAKKFNKSKIYSFDISTIMVDWMKENLVSSHRNIFPILMKDNIVPLENEIADLVMMINLHHELSSQEKTLNECFRLLKPKGKIVISDWKKEKTEFNPPFEIRYESEKVKEELIHAGFKNVNIFNELKYNFLIVAEK
jgi:ubiquinone/menaquinone biosynthesis C-methylase UbiE